MRARVAVALALAACTNEKPLRDPADVASWRNVPIVELERQPFFATLPRAVKPISDGSEIWLYTSCVTSQADAECASTNVLGVRTTTCSPATLSRYCCQHEFFVAHGTIEKYVPVGNCRTGCERRPESRPCPAQ